jgi:hypothetical protein
MRSKQMIIDQWMAELDARRALIQPSRGGTEIKVTPYGGIPFTIRKVPGSTISHRRLL